MGLSDWSGQPGDLRVVAPINKSRAVTPDSNNDLPDGTTRSLYIGTGGNLDAVFSGDATGMVYTRKNVVGGVEYPWSVRRVMATSTCADMVAGY